MTSLNDRHYLPLAGRLVDDEIRRWLDTHLGLLAAQTSDGAPERKIVDQARHLNLAEFSVQLTPRILDVLARAGLLRESGVDDQVDRHRCRLVQRDPR